jgi:hypothetical protein
MMRGSECGRGRGSKREQGRVGGRCGREFRRRARVRARWSTASAGRAELTGEAHDTHREREREGEGTGQQLSDWRIGPVRQRGKRGARAKGMAPTAWPHWVASERDRRVWGSELPLTDGSHMSGGAGARARGLARPSWVDWADESHLEGVDRRKLKFTTLNTLQAGVSVRIKSESGREGKTNQPRK